MISDVYPEEYKENLYRLDVCSLGKDYALRQGDYRDGYVLMVYSDIRDGYGLDVTGTYCLFPLLAPERRIYGKTAPGDVRYSLGPDGTLFEIFENTGVMYRKKPYAGGMSEAWEYGSEAVVLGTTSDGKAWVHTPDGYIRGYAFGTDRTMDESFRIGTEPYVLNDLVYEKGNYLWFKIQTKGGEMSLYSVNRANGRVTTEGGLLHLGNLNDGCIEYDSEKQFQVSKLNETNRIRTFKKQYADEFVSLCAEDRILSRYFEIKGNDQYEDHFRVLSLENGGETGRLDTSIFRSDYSMFDTIGFGKEGYLLIAAYRDDFSSEIFLLDAGGEPAKADASYQIYTPKEKYPRAAETAGRIEANYPGVHVYYEQFALDHCRMYSYEMKASENETMICDFLDLLEQYMGAYPSGFFTDLAGQTKGGLDIYLCDSFRAVSKDVISVPAGLTNTSDKTIEIAFSVKYASALEQNFAHELMHAMEVRIGEYEEQNGVDFARYWREELNSPQYPFADSYLDGKGEMISDYSGTTLYDVTDAWFIDAYAKSNVLEDRARTFEYMYIASPYHFQGAHLRAKAQFLCAVIREVFPSVKASGETMRWESLFGIVPVDGYLTSCKAEH